MSLEPKIYLVCAENNLNLAQAFFAHVKDDSCIIQEYIVVIFGLCHGALVC